MILLLFHLFLYCELITADGKAKFNEADLMEQRHQQVLKVNAYIDGLHQRLNQKQRLDRQKTNFRTAAVTPEMITNEEFLDYHITHLWWNTESEDHETTTISTFLPTPIGHGRFPTQYFDDRYTSQIEETMHPDLKYMFSSTDTSTKEYTLPSAFVTRPSFPFEIPSFPEIGYPPFEVTLPPTPIHPQYPGFTPRFSKELTYPTPKPLPPEGFLPKLNIPPDELSSLTLPGPPTFSFPTNTILPMGSGTQEVLETTLSTVAQTKKITPPNLSEIVKKWLEERSNQSSPSDNLHIGYEPPQPGFYDDEHPTHQTRLPRTTTTTAAADVPEPRETDDVPLGHAILGNVTVSDTTPTTPLAYQHLMDALHEGYLVAFLVELMALVALKEPNHVRDVISHTDAVIFYFVQNGHFFWLGWPLLQVTQDLAIFISTNETDVIQTHARIFYRLLIERRKALSAEVNAIIDYAQALYAPWEGKRLFDAVKGFGDYPYTKIEGYWTCNNLVESFLAPYVRLGAVDTRKKLIELVNKALLARFPQYSHRRLSGDPGEINEEPHHTSLQNSQRETPHSTERTRTKSTRQSKRRNRRRRHRKHNLKHTTQSDRRRQYRPRTEYEFPILRSLKPITTLSTIQRRYHIVTSNYHFRQMNIKSTTKYYINLMTRPTKAMNDITRRRYVSKASPTVRDPKYVSKPNYRRKINADDDKDGLGVVESTEEFKDKAFFYHQVKERFKALNEAKSVKLKAELLRKIVEGSSYSDEEADLKMKLIQALLLENRSVEISSDKNRN